MLHIWCMDTKNYNTYLAETAGDEPMLCDYSHSTFHIAHLPLASRMVLDVKR